jgi:histidyl-tRNA synthetase
VKGNLQYADKAKIPFCLIVGERERQADGVVVRDMRKQQESTIERARLADLAQRIRGGEPTGLTEI